jgi:hypothetical protein
LQVANSIVNGDKRTESGTFFGRDWIDGVPVFEVD